MQSAHTQEQTLTYDPAFAHDVQKGLSASQKHLPSRWFYDRRGSELFQQIMHLEAYYLTRAEYNALERNKAQLVNQFAEGAQSFRLLEFGAGDGLKTKILLRQALAQGAEFSYLPVDISQAALDGLAADLKQEMPALPLTLVQGDYFHAMESLPFHPGERTVVLFLGSNLGNFTQSAAIRFLSEIKQRLHPGDLLLLGLDLKKDPRRILSAYADPEGITAEFNFNLLRRMNRELGANFRLTAFVHHASYDPSTGETKSFLISTCEQTVQFSKLGFEAHFHAWEPLWLELSQKYDLFMTEELARESGFKINRHYRDTREDFLDTLWQV